MVVLAAGEVEACGVLTLERVTTSLFCVAILRFFGLGT